MNRNKTLSYRITDAIVTAFAFAAGAALIAPVVLVAAIPFAG
jgi:hypothetical protein